MNLARIPPQIDRTTFDNGPGHSHACCPAPGTAVSVKVIKDETTRNFKSYIDSITHLCNICKIKTLINNIHVCNLPVLLLYLTDTIQTFRRGVGVRGARGNRTEYTQRRHNLPSPFCLLCSPIGYCDSEMQ